MTGEEKGTWLLMGIAVVAVIAVYTVIAGLISVLFGGAHVILAGVVGAVSVPVAFVAIMGLDGLRHRGEESWTDDMPPIAWALPWIVGLLVTVAVAVLTSPPTGTA